MGYHLILWEWGRFKDREGDRALACIHCGELYLKNYGPFLMQSEIIQICLMATVFLVADRPRLRTLARQFAGSHGKAKRPNLVSLACHEYQSTTS